MAIPKYALSFTGVTYADRERVQTYTWVPIGFDQVHKGMIAADEILSHVKGQLVTFKLAGYENRTETLIAMGNEQYRQLSSKEKASDRDQVG